METRLAAERVCLRMCESDGAGQDEVDDDCDCDWRRVNFVNVAFKAKVFVLFV